MKILLWSESLKKHAFSAFSDKVTTNEVAKEIKDTWYVDSTKVCAPMDLFNYLQLQFQNKIEVGITCLNWNLQLHDSQWDLNCLRNLFITVILMVTSH